MLVFLGATSRFLVSIFETLEWLLGSGQDYTSFKETGSYLMDVQGGWHLETPSPLEGSATSHQDVRYRKFISFIEVSLLYISLYVQTGSFLFQTILLQF